MTIEPPNSKAHEEVVGYGRPPVRTRFKPGQSGNPRGRDSVLMQTMKGHTFITFPWRSGGGSVAPVSESARADYQLTISSLQLQTNVPLG